MEGALCLFQSLREKEKHQERFKKKMQLTDNKSVTILLYRFTDEERFSIAPIYSL